MLGTKRIEYLLADEDGMWRTAVFDVPISVPDCDLDLYAQETFASQAQYRRIVFWGVYAIQPEEAEEDDNAQDA